MAFGQRQRIEAPPQPGTSNLPYGIWAGSTYLPPFVPVTLEVQDTWGAAIEAETEVMSALLASLALQIGNGITPLTLVACLSGINDSLARSADLKNSLAKSLSDLNIAIGTVTLANNQATAILTQRTAAAIQINNFYIANSPDKPTMPSTEDQLKKAVVDSTSLQVATEVLEIVNKFASSSINTISGWITGTETYQTATSWLKSAISSITGSFTSSARSILTKIKGG